MNVVKGNRTWFYFAFGVVSLLLLSVLLWALPAGAAPSGATSGTVAVDKAAVSPTNSIATADRRITITVTDADLNVPLYVGTGPASEVAGIGTADGERLYVPASQGIGTFILALAANNVANSNTTTPIADRDGDGDVDKSDIVIVNANLDGSGAAVDIEVVGIFGAADQGNIQFNIFGAGHGGTGFTVRYASAGKELTRYGKTFTEDLDVPATDLIAGESFTQALSLVVLDSGDSDSIVSSADISFTLTNMSKGALNTAKTAITLTATGVVATGTAITQLNYNGQLTHTQSSALNIGSGDTIVLLTQPVSTSTSDITVVSPSGITITKFGAGRATADFTTSAAIATNATIVITYLGKEVALVPETGLFSGEEFTLVLNSHRLPLQDNNASGTVTTADVTVSVVGKSLTKTNLPYVTSILDAGGLSSAATGTSTGDAIALTHSGDSLALTDDIKVSYKGLEDLVTVKGIRSDTVPVRLQETGPDTGIYTATIIGVSGALGEVNVLNKNLDASSAASGDVNRPNIAVIDTGSIVVTYNDQNPLAARTARTQIEDDAPTFTNITPASGDTTNNTSLKISADASDAIAGINASKITSVIVTIDGTAVTVTADITSAETSVGSGVYKIDYDIGKIAAIKSAVDASTAIESLTITWAIKVKDKAGNEGTTGNQKLTIDNKPPAITAGATTQGTSGTDRDKVTVTFDANMSSSGLEAADFTVDGVAPTGAALDATDKNKIVLTMAANFLPSAKPVVALVGSVNDVGGNALGSGTVTASDGIAPNLTASLSISYTKKETVLTVTSDELISGSLPVLTVNGCGNNSTGDLVCTGDAAGLSSAPTIVIERLSWTFALSTAAGNDGRFNVKASVTDDAGNTGTAGLAGATPTGTGAINFEVDNVLPAPASNPLDGNLTAAQAEPFVIEIDWTGEGSEYDGETQKAVTITKATLDKGKTGERDVLLLVSSRDSRSFSVVVTAIGLGAHTLDFNATDGLQNTRTTDEKISFTVVAPPKFDLSIDAGLNLISLPRNPGIGANSVTDIFGDVEQIKTVFTRDGDVWLTATRDADGNFVGNLTTIDSAHAYFVESTGTVTLNIVVPPQRAEDNLPILYVKGGIFNLVPVISLAAFGTGVDEIKQGTTGDAQAYLGANWSSAFHFDRGLWPGIKNVASAKVAVGKGYWVLFTKDDFLTPLIP